ncbi:hypothetical protein [Asticcacaulis biprosthecium]|uniref:hypothetical protein n=1 Tax=Asticcacaulis biprosthecium TaxID=76891 RepID=UPI0012F4AD09|nr:hypothetical protein [Asticcacaulis biprosthecium]
MSADLKKFEAQLDEAFSNLPVNGANADECLSLACLAYEFVSKQSTTKNSDFIAIAMVVLARKLVSGDAGCETDLEALFQDLQFASHYYMLREYLYYSYNAPGSLAWTFSDDAVEVKFADQTIPRQFFTVWNDQVLGSKEVFEGFNRGHEIRDLLRGQEENDINPATEAAYAIIREEAQIKLDAYFCIIAHDADISLGDYSYSQFITLYRALLEKALYHRYHASVNDKVGPVFIPEHELVAAAMEESSLPAEVTKAILRDIVFDEAAVKERVDASYFSLYRRHEDDDIVMRPHHFAINEGLVNVLRVIATRRPRLFLQNISQALGDGFVARQQRAWDAQGFIVRKNVSLREFDPSLPDIDLLVISEEPTLGYVMFVCELKSPVPPRWAKDQLRVLNKDGVSKAFQQAKTIEDFLGTEQGIAFLRSVLPQEGLPHFDGFITVINHLIVTSDNAGMFFGDEETPIMNFRTLERLLRRADGDIVLIQRVIDDYNEVADSLISTKMIEFEMGTIKVRYEVVGDCQPLDFPQQSWKNSAERQAMIDDFIASGGHPFDVLPHDPRLRNGD